MLVQEMVAWIQAQGGQVTARDLQVRNGRRYPTAQAANAALDALVRDGLGRWLPVETTPRGGRPSRAFSLNPGGIRDTFADDPGDVEEFGFLPLPPAQR
jgi:hypothetical protein